jgi:c-di-GMP-specific phosphodiesterase
MEAMPVSEEELQQRIRALERACLDALTQDMSFVDLGGELCRRIEAAVPGVVASVCRVNDHCLWPWAAPSFSPAYCQAFNGAMIGEGVASCGTAAFRGTPVLTGDIDKDPAWASYKHHVLKYGVRACWSYPIKRPDGRVMGTFAFYSRDAVLPPEYIARIAESCAYMCLLAIEREERNQEYERLIKYDRLTGLLNLHSLNGCLDELMAGDTGRGLGVFIFALSNLHQINDSFGRNAGNQVLVTMAERLRLRARPNMCLGRFSGNDFLVVETNCNADRAVDIADRLLEIGRRPIRVNGETLEISPQVGISWCGSGEEKPHRDELLDMARMALKQVSATDADGSYAFFSPSMNARVQERRLLETELREAIGANRLHMAYQPQVYGETGKLYGFEALARWNNERLGNVPPGQFIPLAEEAGLIDAISFWGLREVCRQLAQWRAEGLVVPGISVNLSATTFRNPGLVGFVVGLLDEFGLKGESLTLEVTESILFERTPATAQAMHDLRARGIGLSVDDFGTGFANLTNLVNLPITEIKIDQSFVAKCPDEGRERTLVEMLIGIGRALAVNVVAEGVETSGQCSWLTTANCPVLQGYLIARPLASDHVSTWMQENY